MPHPNPPFFPTTYLQKLLVKTSERRAVVCEGIAVPTVYRSLVAEILYAQLFSPSNSQPPIALNLRGKAPLLSPPLLPMPHHLSILDTGTSCSSR